MEHRGWTGYLVPTEHRWINEFVGLIVLTFGILLALSLVSFNPEDPSFNISQNPHFAGHPSNFVGLVGATTADLFFQTWGYSAFLFPVFLGIYAFCWLASRPVRSVGVRIAGMIFLTLTLCAAFSLLPVVPLVRGHVPAGGLIGTLIADKLEGSFNAPGTVVILMTSFLVSLLLSTTFSFAWVAQFLKPRFHFISTISERWAEWKVERALAAQQPELKKEKTLKKQTIITEKPKRVEETAANPVALAIANGTCRCTGHPVTPGKNRGPGQR